MSLQSGAMRVSESDAAMFRVIKTDALEFLGIWDRWESVVTCCSNRKALTTMVVILYGGLTDILGARRFRSLRVLT